MIWHILPTFAIKNQPTSTLLPLQTGVGVGGVEIPPSPPRICSAAHPRWFRNLGVDEKLHQAQRLEAGDVP